MRILWEVSAGIAHEVNDHTFNQEPIEVERAKGLLKGLGYEPSLYNFYSHKELGKIIGQHMFDAVTVDWVKRALNVRGVINHILDENQKEIFVLKVKYNYESTHYIICVSKAFELKGGLFWI